MIDYTWITQCRFNANKSSVDLGDLFTDILNVGE